MTAWNAILWRVGLGDRACGAHRAALVDLVDERIAGAEPPADRAARRALEHLGRCGECQREAGDMLLIVAGLRRLGAAARVADGPPDGWPRLAQRLALVPVRRRHRHRLSLAGLAAVPLIAALLVVPGLYRETGMAAGASTDGATVAAPPDVAMPAVHAASLQRSFDIGDDTAAAVAAPASEVVPRGPLPDGMDLAASGLAPGAAVAPAAALAAE